MFVLSSDYEGNPLSVIGAMAAGLPIVSSSVGGVPELLQNGKEGFIVQPCHANELSEAMMTWLYDSKLRGAMSGAAAVRAKAKFDVFAMVRSYEELYEEVSAPCRTRGHFHFGPRSTPSREDLGV